MYASRTTQLFVGIFTLIGIAALVFLSVRLGRVEIIPTPGYTLFANFDNIAGLKTGDQVEIAGVKVGKTTGITLKDNRARVAMHIDNGVEVDSEAIASILTSGLIGDKYVSIALGAGDDLKNGGTIRQTQSAFVLENAIGSFINGGGSKGGSSGSGSSGGGSGAAAPSGGGSSTPSASPTSSTSGPSSGG
ncbi:MAG TPA: outer membrane lipid asymmetry maintenance protein MlaD [Candidatus Binataceae bacterium]|jgi:phospholipid/cholesterol/gamma-HCH transport system substrate-binding protein